MSVAIGIDLGTTNTVVAAVVDGVAVTLEDEQGRRLLPSVVSFHPTGNVLVGDTARERRLIDPENTIFSVKPLLGRSLDPNEVKSAKARFPFELQQGAKSTTMVVARDIAYALPEISAFVLRRAKAIAEAALGQPVERAVITVPANFNDLQRASTKIAGKLAGLDVMRILNEPTAAALAYGQSIAKAEKIAVYDLGGGTFDVTLLDLTGNVFEVLATAGDTALGGDDIDRLIAEKIAFDIIRRYNVDPRNNPASAARLLFIAEELKKELSTAYQAKREISGIGYTEGGHPVVMPILMRRDEMEAIARPLVERTIAVSKKSIEGVGLTAREFDRVILVGGSTRMPLVARMVEELFGQAPHLKVNPDEVVALGAAIQAHALNRTKSAHKRRSGHDQLANAQPKAKDGEQVPTRPPNANPDPAPPLGVPKAPPLPTLGSPAAPKTPEFFTFSKAPAVISFGTPPPFKPPTPPTAAQAPAPRPPQKTLAKPPLPLPSATSDRRGQSDHASRSQQSGGGAIRGSTRVIEGSPSRSAAPEPIAGPKPARSVAPPKAPSSAPPEDITPDIPELVLPTTPRSSSTAIVSAEQQLVEEAPISSPFDFGPPPIATPPEPSIPVSMPSGGIHHLVMDAATTATPQQQPALQIESGIQFGSAFTDERFQRGSAIATSDAAPLLIDVTPLSLGVETAGGYADVLIPANSPVPCEKTRTFLTASDGQSSVTIRVAQGQSSKFAGNTRLGDLELSGLRPARRGEVKIAVTFELDADGILNVRARDQDTGRETAATMRLLGANTDAADVQAMAIRQARHIVL